MVSPLLRITWVQWFCSEFRGVSSKIPVIPIMPLIGVRSSWLIIAKNSLRAWSIAAVSTWPLNSTKPLVMAISSTGVVMGIQTLP